MAHSHNQLDTFIQDVYRRIQIATAVHVIRNTPRGKSHEAYAIELQQKLKLEWLNSALFHGGNCTDSCIDQRVLRQQQDILKTRLLNVVPPNNHQLLEDNSNNTEDSTATNKGDIANEAYFYYDAFNRDRCEVQANSNFIQAVIHLKALAQTQSTIPIQLYINSLSKLEKKSNVFFSDSMGTKAASDLASFNDSGFYNVEDQSSAFTPQGTNSSNVASSMLLYTISSCNADQLLEKSILAIFNQLKSLSTGSVTAWKAFNLHEIMDQWTGSIYQQAIGVIHDLMSPQSVFSDLMVTSNDECFKLTRELIQIIIQDDTPNENSYQMKENQIVMVLQLSEGTNQWFPTLELIFSSLEHLAAKMKKEHEHHLDTSMSCTLDNNKKGSIHERHRDAQLKDNCFYLYRLVKTFFTSRHMKPAEEAVSAGISKSILASNEVALSSVAGLWRKHYETLNVSAVDNCSEAHKLGTINSSLRHWKRILEAPFQDVLHKHPLIAVIIYDCLPMLQSFQE